ncbi:MAG: TraB/GumN family protein [Verrucomicrobiae bacterium]|nr:TraB/GumN family protein [Verrucomicrobiae bacterium]
MSELPPQRSVLSPVVIMLAGLVLLAGSVASFFLVGRGGAGDVGAGVSQPYRGVIFEGRLPVSSGEAGSRVLLMGSMHVLRPQDHPLPVSYGRAFELADAVIFELDSAVDQTLVQKHTTYADGSTLQEHLPADLYERASAAAERAGISMKEMANKRVYLLAQGLAGSVLGRAGFTRSWGVEAQLRDKAAQAGKPVFGFEMAEDQLSVFSSLSADREEALLRQTLDEMEKRPDYGLRGIELWKTGDVDALAALREESKVSDPELARTLFEDRHARWLPVIEEQLTALETPEMTLLVVVGAAHLCGKGSLIELLHERGYAIEQW